MKRILFIAAHRPGRAPNQRYRFEMYIDKLEEAGMFCELSYIISREDDEILYAPGNYLAKGRIALRSYRKRQLDLKRLHEFDLIVICREALLSRSVYFERRMIASGIPVVYDFDDAIWIRDVSAANRRVAWLKNPGKIREILPGCALVTAGNAYLADFARALNANVQIIPSTIDPAYHYPLPRPERPVTIGWSGSLTTLPHLEQVLPVLRKLHEKWGSRIRFLTVGAKTTAAPDLPIEYIPWHKDTENQSLNELDIGLMPLPDDPWTRGKCGMKALLYMAVGKPAVASPVGVNTDIISHEENGMLADTDQEWFEAIDYLIAHTEQRERMGQLALSFVRRHYAKDVWAPRLIEIYRRSMKT